MSTNKPVLIAMKADYSWTEAFSYAKGFGLDDVAEIHASVEGENDGDDWIAFGKLKNGYWFYLHAGCDYTGWDCQAGGDSFMAKTKKEVIRMGMDFGARQRFGLLLPGEGKQP